MAEATTTSSNPGALGVALIRGKITAMRRNNGQRGGVMTIVTMPAPDEFSHPATVELHSTQTLGEVGGTWAGKVRISGIGRRYKTEREDPNTGEVRTVMVSTADNLLSVVE